MNRFKTLPNNDVKQQYALYLAAAEAVARGNRVRVVETDRRYWLKVNGHQAQVRSRGSGTWQFGNWENPLAAETQFVIFADFIDDDEPLPKYYIAPAEWFRDDVQRHSEEWLASHEGVRPINPDTRHHQVPLDRVEEWRDRWDLLA